MPWRDGTFCRHNKFQIGYGILISRIFYIAIVAYIGMVVNYWSQPL